MEVCQIAFNFPLFVCKTKSGKLSARQKVDADLHSDTKVQFLLLLTESY